jgi:hypothetical protein
MKECERACSWFSQKRLDKEVIQMKKLLILVLVVLVLLAAVGPVLADSDEANHPEHIPGFDNNNGDGSISNLPIPPGWAETDPPGPNDP